MTATIYEREADGRRFTHHRAWCVIDLDAVRHNARVLNARAAVPLVAMVKADAYGLGAEAIARALGAPFAEQGGHDFRSRATSVASLWALGVATVAEAVALRDAGCEARILCCSPLVRDELPAALQARIIPSLHRAEDILSWTARSDAPWHLSIDTGMNRAGVRWSDTESLATIIAQHKPQGVYTHFHSAQLANASRELQTQRFAQAIAALQLPPATLLHAANSYTIAAVPSAPSARIAASAQTEPQFVHAAALDLGAATAEPDWQLARPGVSLYGVQANPDIDLKPVLHVYARIVDVRDLHAGETVSYDASWTAQRASRIATVAVGYGDGYRRALSNVGEMIVGRRRVGVVGNVTMDLTMIDVTGVPCEVGDIVTVIGDACTPHSAQDVREIEQPGTQSDALNHNQRSNLRAPSLSVSDVAQQANLSPYELLVGWRLRLPRVYRESL